MNNSNGNKVNMIHSTTKCCENNPTATASIDAFAPELAGVLVRFSLLSKYDFVNLTGTKGVTKDTHEIRKNLTLLTKKFASALYAYASSTGNNALKSKVNYSISQLNRLKIEEIGAVGLEIMNEAATYIAQIGAFGIVPTDMTDFQTLVSTYIDAIQNPRIAKLERMKANAKTREIIGEIIKIFEEKMDPMVETLLPTNPTFVTDYFRARTIIDQGHTYTKFRGTITDANGNGLARIALEIKDANSGITIYNTITDPNGNYILTNIAAGDYHVTIAAAGFEPLTDQGVHIVRGREVGRTEG